jgi:hypothetical protein
MIGGQILTFRLLFGVLEYGAACLVEWGGNRPRPWGKNGQGDIGEGPMPSISRATIFKAKSLFCAALVLAQPVLSGCQSSPITMPDIPVASAGRFHVELTQDHSMTGALEGSAFQGARAIDVYPAEQRFELIFSDDDRAIHGNYAFVNGEFTIVDFEYATKEGSAKFTFSESKQITQISSSRGDWKRPPESPIAPDPTLSGADAYAAANADILELAQQLDESGAKGDGGGLVVLLGFVLLWSAYLFAPVALVSQVLLTIFVVSTVLQLVTGSRFDGTWNATNQLSTLQLTIADGRITRMIDISAQQQLDIIASELQQVQGTNVSWKVQTQLLGNPSTVQFLFNVAELATGALSGTLTTNNSFPATVPVTMTRE